MKTNVNNLVSWIQINHPKLVSDMKLSSHHFSSISPAPHHIESDVWSHLMMVMLMAETYNISKNSKLASLFHDIGKPLCRKEREDNKVAFKGHESLSAFMSLEILESMRVEWKLSDQDIIEIFYAISNHITFHRTYEKCLKDNSLWSFVELFRGMPEIAKTTIDLGICDGLGRFTSDQSPKELSLHKLQERLCDEMVYEQMEETFPKNSNAPIIEVLIGLPCSGKSTYRSKITNMEIICRDDIIMNSKKGSYQEAYQSVNQSQINTQLIELVKENIKLQKNLLIDMTSLSKEKRGLILGRVPHYYKKATLFLEPMDVIYKRNEIRSKKENKHIPKDVFIDMMKDFQCPMIEEFDSIQVFYKGQLIHLK
jgi:predicted kinase